jgi:hypothetical protein
MVRSLAGLASLAIGASGCGRIAFDPIAADASIDAAPDARALPAVCPDDARLIACYPLDGDVLDHSAGDNDAIGSAISFVPGIDGDAVQTTVASRIDLTAPNLDTTQLTVEAWVRTGAPMPEEQLVFDHDSHWALGIIDGAVQCIIGAGSNRSTRQLTPGVWTHIACTHDGTDSTVWIDGQVAATMTTGPYPPGVGASAIAGNAPISNPQAPFVGTVDRVRVWNVARTAAELCAAAGC